MGGLTAPKVLLVEDNEGDARLVSLMLREGFPQSPASVRAKSLSEAIEASKANGFDVVLLDMGLPDSNGIETVRQFVAACPSLPVVVMTGLDDDEVSLEAIQGGAEDYLVKGTPDGKILRRVIRYAWERKRLRTELDLTLSRLNGELDAARIMQGEAVPDPNSLGWLATDYGLYVNSHFEPSAYLGGDFWGVRAVGEDNVWILLADFSGHGIAPALNTFRLHSLFTQHDLHTASPGALLEHLNDALYAQLPLEQYATLLCFRYNRRSDKISYAATGTPPPLLRAAGEKTFRFCESKGLPAGMLPSTRYVEREIDFPPGSDLVLYSDAMVECPDRSGQVLDWEGIQSWVEGIRVNVPEGDPVCQLSNEINRRWELPLGDDLTMVWLSRQLQTDRIS
jgi:sigma-B regulation protein RsbU (phosphoserine phosphatase)